MRKKGRGDLGGVRGVAVDSTGGGGGGGREMVIGGCELMVV